MERCATTGAAANYAGRYTDFVPTGCCGESSYTARNACADPYASYRRANAAENVNYQRTTVVERTVRDCDCDLSAAEQLPVKFQRFLHLRLRKLQRPAVSMKIRFVVIFPTVGVQHNPVQPTV